ncbi:Ig-like domain-containing protein [Pseudozobellia sp. WGM2]|uniref:Ig-like domain-containing protein n=1 Tax=Pseudozobellia sp. WGM2 TaxID=2787625 RepID=UPI001ADF7F44|nr:Ig-like domain-containing protein [Pseudozobellia sp. WGM2]
MKYFPLFLTIILIIVSCSTDSDEDIKDLTPPILTIEIAGTPYAKEEVIYVGKQMEINIDAKDAGGIQMIEAFVDERSVAKDNEPPFQLNIDFSNYSSKLSSKGLNEHILRVDATDNSGNISSEELTINIDNDAPVITNVSLDENAVVAGEEQTVTFEVVDNEEIALVNILLNEELIYEISDNNYEITLDTLQLKTGSNVLKIEAIDIVENSSSYLVNFFMDDIGPTISFNNLAANQIIDEPILVDLSIDDEYSDVASISYLIGDEIFKETTDKVEFDFEFRPIDFNTGKTKVTIVAEDTLGNKSIAEMPIEIMRRLHKLNFPQGFYQHDYDRFYVFASDMKGKLLAVERVLPETETLYLRTYEDIDPSTEFMITFGSYDTNQLGSSSNFFSVTNFTGLDEINLRVPIRIYHKDGVTVPAGGFDSYDLYNSAGGKMGGGQLQNTNTEISFNRNFDISKGVTTDKIYVGLHNLTLDTYSYAVFDWNLNGINEVNADMFTQEGFVTKTFRSDYIRGYDTHVSLICLGFLDDNQYQNWLWNAHGNSITLFNDEYRFVYNDTFYKQKYSLTMGNYHVLGTGVVEDNYPSLNWAIDYSYENNVVNVNPSNGNHIVGRIMLSNLSDEGYDIDGKKVNYHWVISFDSQNQNEIILPEIPDELKTWDFYSFYEQGKLDFLQVELKRYEGILNYQEYLEKVVKDNTPEYLVSPKIESFSKGYYDFHQYYLDQQSPIF